MSITVLSTAAPRKSRARSHETEGYVEGQTARSNHDKIQENNIHEKDLSTLSIYKG